jgi:hypothetical protein
MDDPGALFFIVEQLQNFGPGTIEITSKGSKIQRIGGNIE